jgi:hypothetical protein
VLVGQGGRDGGGVTLPGHDPDGGAAASSSSSTDLQAARLRAVAGLWISTHERMRAARVSAYSLAWYDMDEQFLVHLELACGGA